MTARKRKSPDRKKNVRQPGLVSSLAMGAGRAAARHPKTLFGVATFGIVFSFVAANALWYQPGGHPSPFLATRDATDPNRIAGYRPMRRIAPDDVTTFRIERAAPAAAPPAVTPAPVSPPAAAPLPAGIPAASPAQRPAPPQAAPQQTAAHPAPAPAPSAAPPAAPPVSKPVQAETARTAPSAPARGAQPMPPKPVPASRPVENASARGEDAVAAAIRAADRKPFMTPPADIPNSTGSNPGRSVPPSAQKPAAPLSSAPDAKPSSLVLQIQRGLSNIAYADVEVDGVAGSQTKAAIRRFQKHYRLPETGEPDEMVLKKLKSIGAL
ncbi:peptidoglycan-binding domain-containing protein [Rhizobium terrae]|uniref:peptidoglycan-binding domain-containing protein n=1 Tax=Rhizobium terrae TaxID=2171756 RepID=UPI0013C2F043|nr:peptidoglycan-binding domain-containing protein [Rhizobium terrae]